ncbi:hypothetical protein PHISCL_01580 [Aspergillus sclerotialis]|uniref:Tetratricopeptide-like helical n=1 Tax=Aspergillus sclerotialis TaxID=2070753 RepID=A0A3A3A7W0_9EURO|nr:hypothetical protein PHISCL_01580 [Aspergillus sclerotialis]
MPKKPKSLLKESKSKKKPAQQAPETPDDYLAVGVDHEEAGEKWRAGDAAKSLRFFMRAIANYDEGLRKYPDAFDLAYNKARIQYEITQHPKLAAQLPVPQSEALRVALQSHRDALNLVQDNADAFFNTAQVLTSLAEITTESKQPSQEQFLEAVKFLQEAIELFQRCLMLQELRFTESQEQFSQLESAETPSVGSQAEKEDTTDQQSSDPQEQWVAIVEPVTKDTLVDTAVAQLDTLTTLSNLLAFNPEAGISWVDEYSSELLRTKLPAYLEGSNRHHEASLARARFISALSEVLYRSQRIEVETYHREIMCAYGPELDLSADPGGLCSKADALTSLNAAASSLPPVDPNALSKSLMLRWQSLSSALDALTAASKIPGAEHLSKIHLARGDVEMHRWRLGHPPWSHAMAQQNAPILIRNAQTYYRGAAALARRDGAAEEARDGVCKEALAAALEGQKEKLEQLKASAPRELLTVAEDMVEDGFVNPMDMESLLS